MNQVAARESEWKVIDQELRTLARNRCRLDADEMPLLCAVIRTQVWRHFDMVTVFEYLEVVLGYGPRVARDRVRVALALEKMPVLADALASGEQSYSAVRELTRVATPETQDAWRADARGKNLRQIEEVVAVHEHGDLPTDPPKHDLKPRVLAYQVTTAICAKERQVRRLLEDELGEALDDKTFIETLLSLVLDGSPGADEGRARHQIQTTICASCQLGWHDAGGRRFAISAVDVARAECDAQRIGSDREPAKASQDVTPITRRHVFRRDRGNCAVPGCRSARNIEVHHIVPRAAGGSHEAENLTLLCGGHHDLLHEGRLKITGQAPNLTFARSPVVEAKPKPNHVDTRHGATETQGRSDHAAHVGHIDIGDDEADETDTKGRTRPIDHVAHVGTGEDEELEPTIRTPPQRRNNYQWVVMKTEATSALAQAGFRNKARALVEHAAANAPPDITLEGLIRAALRVSR
jgi:hypothetical protein